MNRFVRKAVRIGAGGATVAGGLLLLQEGLPVTIDGISQEYRETPPQSSIQPHDEISGEELGQALLVTLAGAIITVGGVVVMCRVAEEPHR